MAGLLLGIRAVISGKSLLAKEDGGEFSEESHERRFGVDPEEYQIGVTNLGMRGVVLL